MRACAIMIVLILGTLPGQAGVDAVDVSDPRPFGYFIGDTLERRIEIKTSGTTTLFSEALPRPGPVTYWLDLASIDHEERSQGDGRVYTIHLKYQLFYSALEATKLEIPAIPLKFSDATAPATPGAANSAGEAAKNSAISAFSFLMSPLRDIVLQDLMPGQSSEIGDVLRPDKPAHLLGAGNYLSGLALAALGILISAAGLLWHYAIWPFTRRVGRPFTKADREIRDLSFSGLDADMAYRRSLIILHRAIDESFGRRVFASDFADLFRDRPSFQAFLPKLAAFFNSSRLFFFSEDKSAAEREFSPDDLRTLASDLARVERSAP
jgi:mxaA protein